MTFGIKKTQSGSQTDKKTVSLYAYTDRFQIVHHQGKFTSRSAGHIIFLHYRKEISYNANNPIGLTVERGKYEKNEVSAGRNGFISHSRKQNTN